MLQSFFATDMIEHIEQSFSQILKVVEYGEENILDPLPELRRKDAEGKRRHSSFKLSRILQTL